MSDATTTEAGVPTQTDAAAVPTIDVLAQSEGGCCGGGSCGV